jgi:hypothetical protein
MIPTQSPVLDNLGSFPGPLSSRCSLTSTFCQRRHLLTVLTPPISSTALGRSICVCVCLYRMEEARKGLFPIFRYLTAAIWLTTSRGESVPVYGTISTSGKHILLCSRFMLLQQRIEGNSDRIMIFRQSDRTIGLK